MQSETLKIYCDGGARGNPGPAASAFVVKNEEEQVLHEESKVLGVATNNIAEYTAVLMASEWLARNAGKTQAIEFFLDSLLVVSQLNGEFKIKNQKLGKIAQEIKVLLSKIPTTVTFQHIRREKNSYADSLVNRSLDAEI